MKTKTKPFLFALFLASISGFCVGNILVAMIDVTMSLEFTSGYEEPHYGTFVYVIEGEGE
jgi:hypothetical protein